ncbi:hydrogen gas-evolving membrane-bound hydrogenase subunit E [Moheibacter lacus]|uniref:DUF4040 domain-containing protein n=1 Tax=Moheibacter lacus TaxID=2745851 RepID=A0A838ZTY9_9FLAO|nr:hydrogen gas-evolving membrane-bound hydrogenase subunit E [Moheibacter lacus]MBA5630431.1 DUF4040 domain-containing protein [Moheibacter lacus]
MLIVLLSVFVLAFLILFSGKFILPKYFKVFTVFPLLLFTYFSYYLINLQWEPELLLKYNWIPTLGINLDFKIDGLSVLFAMMITGIGSLIYFYSSNYLKKVAYLNRFYGYLTLFMGAMLGLVLSDNLITLFIFWELTSISSFFLIGFNNEEESSRKSAMTAFAITGLGGFLLLSGFLILGNLGGSYSITELLNSKELIQNHGIYILLITLIFGGAFTKSAQFPFHFWLPGAMAAPTPVSAYLHSATMVKAGIYVLARFTPLLSDGCYWNQTLMIVGGITMIYGAFHSVFRTDLKAILAYSTISALGIIVFLLGIGTEYAIYAAVTFIVVHALYKAALFLTAGIIDHGVHTRNITQISGLGKYMPLVGIAAVIAALSSAGVPLMFGFISKDLIYESTLNFAQWGIGLTALAVATNVFLVCSGFLAGIKPFIGKPSHEASAVHRPSFYLWFPVVVLSVLTLIFGMLPFFVDQGILKYAFDSISIVETNLYLKLWHGFNLVLGLSVLTIVLGTLLFFANQYFNSISNTLNKLNSISPENISQRLGESFRNFAFIYTRLLHNGYLRNYLIVIIVFITLLVGYRFFSTIPIQVITEDLSGFRIYELTVFIIILISIFYILFTTSRLTAIASLGIIGYGISLIFVFYGAPDLAMTQFAIDTLTVVLFVLVLFKLPSFLPFRNKKIIFRDAVISLSFGGLIMLIALQSLMYPASKEISRFYADNAYTLAKGKNVVNVILVDFRGFDTLIESIVLSIAALGVYGILKYRGINEKAD